MSLIKPSYQNRKANNTRIAKAKKSEVFSVIRTALHEYYGNKVFAVLPPRSLSIRLEDEAGQITTVSVDVTGRARE